MDIENDERRILVEALKMLKEGNLRLADITYEEGIKLTDQIHLEEFLMDEFDLSDERACVVKSTNPVQITVNIKKVLFNMIFS